MYKILLLAVVALVCISCNSKKNTQTDTDQPENQDMISEQITHPEQDEPTENIQTDEDNVFPGQDESEEVEEDITELEEDEDNIIETEEDVSAFDEDTSTVDEDETSDEDIPTTINFEEVHADWCLTAQILLENFDENTFPKDVVTNNMHTIQDDFVNSKPDVDNESLTIQTFVPEITDDTDIAQYQIWCKMKTQSQILGKNIVESAQGDFRPCAYMNEYVLNWALDNVPASVRKVYEERNIIIDYTEDESHSRGDQWVPSQFLFEKTGDGTYEMTATVMRTANWIPVLGGNNYCKLFSPEGAVHFVESIATEE